MTKAITLDLTAQLEIAQHSYTETVTVSSGGARITIKPANAAKAIKALKNCHRAPRAKAELRTYPKFTPGMSTAEYVVAYGAMNKHGVLPGMALNTEPCGLYEGGVGDYDVVEEVEEVAASADRINEFMAAEIAATAEVAAPLVVVPAPPEYVALRTAARAARRAAVAAINTARVSSAQAASAPEVATDGADYSYLIPADGQHAGGVAAAKNIRLVLKNQFPGVKFKVTSDYSSVNVRWIDGPVTGAVDDALAPFDIGHSDSQSDYFYTERTRFSEKFGGVQYLFTRRELSDSAVTASIHAIFGADGPTLAEWQRGTAWAQVAHKGAYRDAQMWDQYEWLAMVRRHAGEK